MTRTVRGHIDARLAATEAAIAPPSLTLRLSLGPTNNNAYRNTARGRALTQAASDYKEAVYWTVKEALSLGAPWPLPPPYALSFWLYVDGKSRRDADGSTKLAQDAICAALGINDRLVSEVHTFRRRDDANPRIDVVMRTVETG